MLALIRGDAEGLLHEAVWLVAIAVRTAVGVVFLVHHAVAVGILVVTRAATLTLHFAVGKEASRDATRTPRFAVGPSSHASFALVPDEDGA